MIKAEKSLASLDPPAPVPLAPAPPTMLCGVEEVGGGGTAVLAMKESKSFSW